MPVGYVIRRARCISVPTPCCGNSRRSLDDHSPLPTDPGDDRGPVFVVMAAPGLAFFAAATGSAPQGLWATMFGLAFLPGSVIEVIRFHCTRHLAIDFVGYS